MRDGRQQSIAFNKNTNAAYELYGKSCQLYVSNNSTRLTIFFSYFKIRNKVGDGLNCENSLS